MIHSKLISDAISKKIDCIKQVKSISSCYLHTRDADLGKINTVLQMIKDKGADIPEIIYGKVYHNAYITFFFTDTEEVVLEKINELKPVVTKKFDTPEKVITKMIALRLVKIHKFILDRNIVVSKYPGNKHYTYIPEIVKSDLHEKFTMQHYSTFYIKDLASIRKLLSRKEVTEKAIDDAWNMYSVHEIMDS